MFNSGIRVYYIWNISNAFIEHLSFLHRTLLIREKTLANALSYHIVQFVAQLVLFHEIFSLRCYEPNQTFCEPKVFTSIYTTANTVTARTTTSTRYNPLLSEFEYNDTDNYEVFEKHIKMDPLLGVGNHFDYPN